MKVSAIKQVELMAAKRGDVVSLAQGIPAFDTPEPLKQAAIKAMLEGKTAAYSLTYGMPELRKLIQARLAAEGMDYDWETEIVVTCGATEAITASLRALVSRERPEVVVAVPSYASYTGYVKAAGGVAHFVGLTEDQGWALDLDAARAAIGPRTAAVLVANPNNPTGHCYSQAELDALVELCEKYDCKLITDEVYRDFMLEGGSAYTPAADDRNRKTVIRVYSFSKAFCMTGWRVAFLHSDRGVVDQVVGVHDAFVTCAPVVSQYAAMSALTEGEPYVAEFRAILRRQRDELCAWLDGHKRMFRYDKPAAAYFVFPRLVRDQDDWAFTERLLHEAGVAVVPGSAFGPNTAGHVRMCFGRSAEDIREACVRMDAWLKR
jgi:aminotransferase